MKFLFHYLLTFMNVVSNWHPSIHPSLHSSGFVLSSEMERESDEDPCDFHASLHSVRLSSLRHSAGCHIQTHRGLERAGVHLFCRHHLNNHWLWRFCRGRGRAALPSREQWWWVASKLFRLFFTLAFMSLENNKDAPIADYFMF